jgi:hypothetical protein
MPKMAVINALRMFVNRGAVKLSQDSRQQRRARARTTSIAEVNGRFGFEPRKARRRIAFALARKATRAVPR